MFLLDIQDGNKIWMCFSLYKINYFSEFVIPLISCDIRFIIFHYEFGLMTFKDLYLSEMWVFTYLDKLQSLREVRLCYSHIQIIILTILR